MGMGGRHGRKDGRWKQETGTWREAGERGSGTGRTVGMSGWHGCRGGRGHGRAREGGWQVKYDDLEAVKEYILAEVPNRNTARRYYGALVKLFADVNVEKDIKSLDEAFYRERIPTLFRTRNEVSAAKNGLKYFQAFLEEKGMAESFPEADFYHEVNRKKRNRSVKPRKVLCFDEIRRKINQIQDEKLKYAYRLALISGLRVSELAALSADKLSFADGLIFVNVTAGKGGSNGIVECRPDPYLYDRLQQYIRAHPAGRLFYAESTMRKKAWKLGLECHDLRRIFAMTERDRLKQEMGTQEANRIVQERLRHKRFSTTKRYLFNRKLVIKKVKGREMDEKKHV